MTSATSDIYLITVTRRHTEMNHHWKGVKKFLVSCGRSDVLQRWQVGTQSRLGGVVASVLATGPKGSGFKPSRGDGFLRAIKFAAHLPLVGK
jgi:hypothetical protein